MKTLILLAAIGSFTTMSCSKEIERAFSATIIRIPTSGISVGDSTLQAVLAATNNDTLLLANIPKADTVGQVIKFNIRPVKKGDPVVVISDIFPPLQFVTDLR